MFAADAGVRRKRVIGLVAAIFLGAVLLFASYAKLLEPSAFVEQVHLEGLDFLLPATGVALVAILLETGLGVALLFGLLNRWVLAGTALLSGFFIYLTGRNYWLVSQGLRDPDASCGCFGSLVERTPAEAFWQDLLLLGIPLLILLWAGPRFSRLPRFRSGVSATAGLLAVVVMLRSPGFTAAADAMRFGQDVTDHSFKAMAAPVLVDGKEDESATVYFSESRASFLIVSARFEAPIVVDPRQKEFRTLPSSAIRQGPQGEMEVDEEVAPLSTGAFTLSPQGINFTLQTLQVTLVP